MKATNEGAPQYRPGSVEAPVGPSAQPADEAPPATAKTLPVEVIPWLPPGVALLLLVMTGLIWALAL